LAGFCFKGSKTVTVKREVEKEKIIEINEDQSMREAKTVLSLL